MNKTSNTEVMNFEDIRKMDDKKFCKWLEIIWKAGARMERLTARDKGYAYYPKCLEEPCDGDGCKNDECEMH